MVREGGEVTCEETEKVQWTGEAGEGYHQPGWLDFSFTIFIKTRLFSIFIYNFDQNQVVCVFSLTKLIKTRLSVYFYLQF